MYYHFWGVMDDSFKRFSGDALLGIGLLCCLCMTLLMQMAKCVGHTVEGNILAGLSAVFMMLSCTVLVYRNIRERESIPYSMVFALGLMLVFAYINISTIVLALWDHPSFMGSAVVILAKNLSKRMGQWIWSGVQWQMDAMRREASSAVGETWNKVWRMVYLAGKVYVWVCRMFRFFGKR